MRTSVKVASTLILLVASIAGAQQTPSFDGKWKGQMVSTTGTPVAVDVVMKGDSGTVRLSSRGYSYNSENADPCHGRDIPVGVESRAESELTFVVKGDAALKGCFKGSGTLKLIDAKNVDGTLKDGRSFKLVRK